MGLREKYEAFRVCKSRILRHANSQLARDPESHRQSSGQLAVHLHGHLRRTMHPYLCHLEILHVVHARVPADEDAGEKARDVEITERLENEDIEQPVIALRLWKKNQLGAVEPPISDEDERTFRGCPARLDEQ